LQSVPDHFTLAIPIQFRLNQIKRPVGTVAEEFDADWTGNQVGQLKTTGIHPFVCENELKVESTFSAVFPIAQTPKFCH